MASHQDGQLLSKRYIFLHQIRARAEKLASQERQEAEQTEHETGLTREIAPIPQDCICKIQKRIAIFASRNLIKQFSL
jgi:CII-binding regulator of phage lambda lysogenization HflD